MTSHTVYPVPEAEAWLVKSGDSGALYTVTANVVVGNLCCTCKAGQQDQRCKHVAAVIDHIRKRLAEAQA